MYFTKKMNAKTIINYERIKQLIDIFFIIEQFLREFDLRYDLFLASVLRQHKDESIYLPPEINILSWNYDYQFDYSLSKFYNNPLLNNIRSKYYNLNLNDKTSNLRPAFKLFKLNGSAGGFYENGNFYSDGINFKLYLNNTEKELIDTNLLEITSCAD